MSSEEKKFAVKEHGMWRGKIEIAPRVQINNSDDLAVAYTPGVANICQEIVQDPSLSYEYTRRWNTVAVITDGTAVLGLGDIGPLAGMPVMEGKCLLFKTFGNVDAIPLCIKSKSVDEIVKVIELLSDSFGGVNLEDISAPRCFEIEKRLKEKCDIPIFHDDQHGTATVVSAALINALKLVKKDLSKIKVVINGAGAAGIAIADLLLHLGVNNIIMCDKFGILERHDKNLSSAHLEIAKKTNPYDLVGDLSLALTNADVFIGVSGPNCVTKEMIKLMNEKAIVFPLANPIPEISRNDALEAGAYIVGTGSSKYPNQINNVLIFPGLFRGVLDARAKLISNEMLAAAAYALANVIKEEDLSIDNIIPKAFDMYAHQVVADCVYQFAKKNE